MTMPDILINTENIFLNRGICELLSEIAKEEHIRKPYSIVDCSTDILGPIDMLFTEMAAGEHYLCHPFFSHKTIFSHKINIMKKFHIATKQELTRFSSVALALSAGRIG